MPRPTRDSYLIQFARRGAESRLRELVEELRTLTSAFPHLRDSFDADELPINFILRRGRDKAAARPTGRRRRRKAWTAAQRKAVSERMRKYWAKRRRVTNK